MSTAKKQFLMVQHYLINEKIRKEITKNGKQVLQDRKRNYARNDSKGS